MLLRALHRIAALLFLLPIRQAALVMLAAVLVVAQSGCSLQQFAKAEAQQTRLVAGALSDPKTFNPVLSQESPNVFSYTFEGLTSTDGVTGEVVPALAESWDISEDGRTVVFTLRKDLRWSDGEPLTADDVVFTYEDVIFNPEIPNNSRDGFRIGREGLLPKASKLDSRRVQFSLPEPFAPFLRTTSLEVLPEHVLRPLVEAEGADGTPQFVSAWGTDTPPDQLVSNGPYRIKQYIPAERVVFERNPYYWREEQPYIQEFVWQVVESLDNQLLQFRSGGLDLMGVSPNYFSLLKQEEKRGNFTIYNGGPALGTNFMAFNLNRASRDGNPLVDPVKSAWFNSVEFRQAVSFAIDRQAMINNIFRGIGEPQTSPISVPSPYYAPPEAGITTYDYNPEKAKELLLSAGFQYSEEGELLDAAGNPVRFTLVTNSGNTIREGIGAQIKRDLANIGIQVDFQPLAFNVLVDKLTDSLDWESLVLGLTGGLEPNGGANVWLLDGALHAFNQQAVAGQEPLQGWQAADWETEIANLYIKAAQEIDEPERQRLYLITQQLTQEYLPFIYLVNTLSMGAVRNKIDGIEYSSIGGSLWNIYELQIEE